MKKKNSEQTGVGIQSNFIEIERSSQNTALVGHLVVGSDDGRK
jgi:hypothetical protein